MGRVIRGPSGRAKNPSPRVRREPRALPVVPRNMLSRNSHSAIALSRAGLMALSLLLTVPAQARPAMPTAPDFPALGAESWINSPPLQLSLLRGQPVLIEFWTFGCQNCRRSIAWVNSVYRRFGRQMQVIGVHTPEFAYERGRDAVASKVEAFEISYPVMLDNDMSYWNALGNRYWPAFYLLDGSGRIQDIWAGEVLEGSARAQEIENAIRQQLSQPQ